MNAVMSKKRSLEYDTIMNVVQDAQKQRKQSPMVTVARFRKSGKVSEKKRADGIAKAVAFLFFGFLLGCMVGGLL